MNIQLGATFKLLKTELSAIYEKQDEDHVFLLSPISLEDSPGVSLDEMLASFKAAFEVNEETI